MIMNMTSKDNKNISDKPLITFALFSYNQEKFIRAAVEGAFSQTYEPLEIILSDDCSTDRTFEIMQSMAQEYDGPHKIIINRNAQNQGLVSHLNKVVIELSHGEIIVIAAGDDVSLPDRVNVLYKLWDDNNRKFCTMYSAGYSINFEGKDLGIFRPTNIISDIVKYIDDELFVFGATSAWHKSVFEIFGEIDKGVILEDAVIGFRGLLLGGIGYTDVPLVEYRHGVGITSKLRTPDEWGVLELSNQHRKDMKKINFSDTNLECALKRRELKYEYRKALLSTHVGRVNKSIKAILGGVRIRVVAKDYIQYRHPLLYTTIGKIKRSFLEGVSVRKVGIRS